MDQIDLRILKLLQQRTDLSRQIGKAKRLHRAAIYVPEREHELLVRLIRRSGGKPSAKAIEAIYREIFSSSRDAQGQPEIGLLQASAPAIISPARWYLGACDRFVLKGRWTELAHGLQTGTLTTVLLTGTDLARLLQKTLAFRYFLDHLTIIGDFPAGGGPAFPLSQRVFIVAPQRKKVFLETNRALILIKCKSTANAVKSLLHAMPVHFIQAKSLSLRAKPAPGTMVFNLVRLTLARPVDGIHAANQLLAASRAADLSLSILGTYLGTEDYAG